jgi:hypothetical protein
MIYEFSTPLKCSKENQSSIKEEESSPKETVLASGPNRFPLW